VPIDGQPKSIVQDLENMARTYIKVRAVATKLLSCVCVHTVSFCLAD
jgi:hypothetical protein